MKLADMGNLDWDWFCVDDDGSVAVFSTAGHGFAPDLFNGEPIGALIADETFMELEARILELKPSCRSKGDRSWAEFGKRGLYAFDWTDVHKTGDYTNAYWCVAKPSKPIHVNELRALIPNFQHSILRDNRLFKNSDGFNMADFS